MDMREVLLEVAAKYDSAAGTGPDVPGQVALRDIEKRANLNLPDGCIAMGRGGQGTPAATPWVGIFDREITTDPKSGLYLAYIFGADLASVTLTLQQGTTRLERRLGRGQALREHLSRNASRLTQWLPSQDAQGWLEKPRFGDRGDRPRAYEASSVAARRYDVADLPNELELQTDLLQALRLLRAAAESERQSLQVEEGIPLLTMGFMGEPHGVTDPLEGFHPKDSSEYVANIAARQQIKSRKHEALIHDFGLYVADRAYVPITERVHPRDLILRSAESGAGEGPEWLVEAKAVRAGNQTAAVREVVGQLNEYRYFLYRERRRADPHLLGLFTHDIGVYSRYLEDHGIASVWQADGGWQGSPLAVEWNLVSAS